MLRVSVGPDQNMLQQDFLWRKMVESLPPVAYLPHARMAEPQKQLFLSNRRTNNGTTGLCNLLLGNGSVNTLLRRRNDVTLQQYLAIV
jgi:hypothetical protein